MTGKTVLKRKRSREKIQVRKNRNVQFLNSIQLPIKNRFDPLANNDDNDMETEQQQEQKKHSISPIVVPDHVSDIQSIFTALNLKCNLKLNSVGRKILPDSAEEKQKIIEQLKEKNIGFFTHPEKDTKAFKVILSGLPAVDTSEIERSLVEQNITPSKITMFNTKSTNKLFLIHFDASQVNKKTLETVKYVYHHSIKWLPYKPKRNGPTICMRCCMYGHGISSCNRFIVCMLCAGTHLTKDCTTHNRENNTNENFKCFNCMSAKLRYDHKANDINCPFREKYETARNNARSKRTTTNQSAQANTSRFAPAPTPPPLRTSFADSMRNTASSSSSRAPFSATSTTRNTQSHANTESRSNTTSTQSNVNNNLWSFDECANILFDSIERLQQCKTKFDQLKVIAELLKHACK